MLIHNRRLLMILLVVALFLLPLLFVNSSYIILLFCTSGIAIMVVSGLDVLFGYSGQISLGHAGFYCIGAYTSAILSKMYGVPVFLSMLLAGVLAVVIAVLIALPAAKLVHHFLALITISFGELMYLFVAHADNITRGFVGINFIPKPSFFGFIFDTNLRYYYLVIVIMLILLLIKSHIISSRTGRALIAIRENVHAANGIGINVMKYKILAFAVSAFYAAIGGSLYAHFIGYISPESFTYSQSVIFLTMLLFGGMGNLWGPIVGATILTFVAEWLQPLGSYQMLVYGTFLLLIVVYIPSGLTRGINVAKIIPKWHKGKNGDKHNAITDR